MLALNVRMAIRGDSILRPRILCWVFTPDNANFLEQESVLVILSNGTSAPNGAAGVRAMQ